MGWFGLVWDWAVKYATFEGIFYVFMGKKNFESDKVPTTSGGNNVLEVVKVSEAIEKWAEKTKMGAFLEERLAHLVH